VCQAKSPAGKTNAVLLQVGDKAYQVCFYRVPQLLFWITSKVFGILSSLPLRLKENLLVCFLVKPRIQISLKRISQIVLSTTDTTL
jgi:hypothetical protein